MTWGSAGQMCGRMLPWDMRHVKMRKRTIRKVVSPAQEREYATKTGLGIYAVSAGSLKVAAVVVLNALGDIYDPSTGEKIAGPKLPGMDGFADSREALYKLSQQTDLFRAKNSNTTIGAIITNGDFSKAELNKIASMTRSAYSRCINPVGTMADGDSIYAARSL